MALAHSEAFGHCLDAIVRSGQQLFRIAKTSVIMAARPALTSASAPYSMTRCFPLPARRSFASAQPLNCGTPPQLPIQSQGEEKVMGELEGKAQFFLSAVEKASTGLTPFAGHTKQAHFSA